MWVKIALDVIRMLFKFFEKVLVFCIRGVIGVLEIFFVIESLVLVIVVFISESRSFIFYLLIVNFLFIIRDYGKK